MYEKEIAALTDAGVRFVVIGAIALGLHNYPRATMDFDILPDVEQENLRRMVETLKALGYRPSLPVDAEQLLDPAKREAWHRDKHMEVFPFYLEGPPPRQIDVMILPPKPFEEYIQESKPVAIAGRTVHIASIRDLLFFKQTASREKDLMDIKILMALQEIEREENA